MAISASSAPAARPVDSVLGSSSVSVY
jgi:hypothetical protein